MADLDSLIKAVIDSCVDNGKKKVLKVGSMAAKISVSHLLALSDSLKRRLDLDSSIYSITVSYGVGNFPKVIWVGITRKGRKVSNSVSVALCFSRSGEGFVCGAMLFRRKLKGQYQTVDRSGKYIAIKGGSTKSDYTNRFFNPKDFYAGNFSIEELIKHIKSSIQVMDNLLNSSEFSAL